jgi:hypothetical protein
MVVMLLFFMGGVMKWVKLMGLWERKRERELIDYVEQEAKIALAFTIECSDHMSRQAGTLLAILLGGAGGSLGLVITLLNSDAVRWLAIGTAVTSIYLFFVSAVLVLRCMMSRDIAPPANDPAHNYQPHLNLTALQVRKYELDHRQTAIEINHRRNDETARWLNLVRVMATMTPHILLLSWLFFG